MKTLLIVNDDGYISVCPVCKTITEEIDSEEYIGANCSIECTNRAWNLFFICPTGYSQDYRWDKYPVEIDNLHKGTVEHSCSVKITKQEAIDYIAENNIDINLDKNGIFCTRNNKISSDNCYYYLVGVLCIKRVGRTEDCISENDNYQLNTILNDEKVFYNKTSSIMLHNIEGDTSHDGTPLYYKGKCTECDKSYESFITGD
ncbi:Hypothetical protein PACV_71 [Pacmanvirus A23]|uniref:Hypothetical protein n=1 Tax=Pacmanvirus A23 TaxID=1932881 RepID=UPI000A092004|nr:Hypothetical protein B9W72_gp071 [Pacmanvirus A23]SIP85788.1 Hypothetical protein PACV_71 [Pacmanvirus A23]